MNERMAEHLRRLRGTCSLEKIGLQGLLHGLLAKKDRGVISPFPEVGLSSSNVGFCLLPPDPDLGSHKK